MRPITVASWIGKAKSLGVPMSHWQARAASQTPPTAATHQTGGLFSPVLFASSNLVAIPWLVEGFATLGSLTVLAAPGGGAKTVAMVDLAVSVVAAKQNWMGFPITRKANGKPHRVAILSGEENANKIGLLVSASCDTNHLDAIQRQRVGANLLMLDAGKIGFRLGEPRPGTHEEISPEKDDFWCNKLRAELAIQDISMLILDTMAVTIAFPSENDNSHGTALMRRLARIGEEFCCAIVLTHHTPKMSRAAAADLRGDASVVRGGGFIVNSARIVWTLMGLPAAEVALFAASAKNIDNIRRLDAVKLNDAPKPPHVFLEVVTVPVKLCDGTSESVRAVRPIIVPQVGTGLFSTLLLDAAMKAIDIGVVTQNGTRLALSEKAGARSAKIHIGNAMMAVNQQLTPQQAGNVAVQVLKELLRQGCAEVIKVPIPKFKKDGSSNGHDQRDGLVTHWHLCSWTAGNTPPQAAQPANPQPSAQTPHVPSASPPAVPTPGGPP